MNELLEFNWVQYANKSASLLLPFEFKGKSQKSLHLIYINGSY